MPGVAFVVADLLARTRWEDAARAEGWAVVAHATEADLVVVDLDQHGALTRLEHLLAHGSRPVVGFVSHVDSATRARAEELGVVVYTRGQAASRAREILREFGS